MSKFLSLQATRLFQHIQTCQSMLRMAEERESQQQNPPGPNPMPKEGQLALMLQPEAQPADVLSLAEAGLQDPRMREMQRGLQMVDARRNLSA